MSVSAQKGIWSKKGPSSPLIFVSNAAILIILSQGSDPLQMQLYYEKVFDSVNQVEHDKSDKGKILAIKNISGSDEERAN